MLWGALWENVHVAKSAPGTYLELALRSLPVESDESLARIQGGRIATVLHDYFSEAARKKAIAGVEAVVADRMIHAPDLGLRIVNFRTFTSIAETPAALQQIKDLLSGKFVVPGLTLKPLDRWNLIGHLMQMNDPDGQLLYSAELARDSSGESQKYAYAAAAGSPNPEAKAHFFEQYLHSTVVQEDWITLSLRPFNAWNQGDLTAPYLRRALDQLPEIKAHRKIFFLGAWLNAFIGGQKTPFAQETVQKWLAAHQSGPTQLDPDLRLKVLEVSDTLDRTVLIRQKYPD
jgi:aminopeptidase N